MITLFTGARHRTLARAKRIQSTTSHSILSAFYVIYTPTYTYVFLAIFSFQIFWPKFCIISHLSHAHIMAPLIFSSLIWSSNVRHQILCWRRSVWSHSRPSQPWSMSSEVRIAVLHEWFKLKTPDFSFDLSSRHRFIDHLFIWQHPS